MQYPKPKRWRRAIAPFLCSFCIFLLWTSAVAQEPGAAADRVNIGGDVRVMANQGVRDATAIAGSVIVETDARVTGDAVAVGGDVILEAGSSVAGDATAIGGRILQAAGAKVGGETTIVWEGRAGGWNQVRTWGWQGLLGRLYLFSAAVHLLVVLAITALGVLLILLQPRFLQILAATVAREPLKSGLWGLGTAIALMLLSILLSGSILGVIFLPVVNLGVLVAILLGSIGVGLLLGERTLPQRRSPVSHLLVGMLILAVLGLIPLVGWLFLLGVNLFGLGAIVISRFGRRPPAIA